MGQTRVVLLGHNFNSILGLARALGPQGYEVCVIRTSISRSKNLLKAAGQRPESKSKYISRYTTADSKTDDQILDVLIHQFAPAGEKGILFPVDDRCAEIIDRNLERLSAYYYLPNVGNNPGGVIRLMDKYYQKTLAKAAGLPVPEGWSVRITDGKYEIPDGVTYPCFVKAEFPMAKRKAFMRKCSDRGELTAAMDKAAAYRDCVMIVEEFVDIEKEYGAVGMCSRGSVCIPGITEKTAVGHGSQAGVTVCGKLHAPSEFQEAVEKMKVMMKNTGLQGLFDIELYESKGVLYFCELNVRLGAEGVGTLLAGVNLAEMLIKSFLSSSENLDYEATAENISFTNERPLSCEFGEGFISLKEYKQAIKNNDFRCIYSPDDKAPYVNYLFSLPWQFARRLLRKTGAK